MLLYKSATVDVNVDVRSLRPSIFHPLPILVDDVPHLKRMPRMLLVAVISAEVKAALYASSPDILLNVPSLNFRSLQMPPSNPLNVIGSDGGAGMLGGLDGGADSAMPMMYCMLKSESVCT